MRVHNVHLRFEDCALLAPPLVAPGTRMAAGIFFHSCQASTTDAHGNPGTSKSADVVHKSVSLKGFAAYLDIDEGGSEGFAAPLQLSESGASFSKQMQQLMRLLKVTCLFLHRYLRLGRRPVI